MVQDRLTTHCMQRTHIKRINMEMTRSRVVGVVRLLSRAHKAGFHDIH